MSTRYRPNPQDNAVRKMAMSSRIGAGNVFITSSSVVRTRLRMNQYAEYFRGNMLESQFELGLNVVDPGERKII